MRSRWTGLLALLLAMLIPFQVSAHAVAEPMSSWQGEFSIFTLTQGDGDEVRIVVEATMEEIASRVGFSIESWRSDKEIDPKQTVRALVESGLVEPSEVSKVADIQNVKWVAYQTSVDGAVASQHASKHASAGVVPMLIFWITGALIFSGWVAATVSE